VNLFNFLADFSGVLGYAGVVVVLMVCGLGLPLPEDVVLITGGYLAYLGPDRNGVASVEVMVGVALFGILFGDSVTYGLGRRFGDALADRTLLGRIATKEKRHRAVQLFEKYGPKIVMIARFMPGVRAVSYFVAGASKMPYLRFIAFDAVAACVSAPLWVLLGWHFGAEIETAFKVAKRAQWILFALGILVIGTWLFLRQRRRAREPAVDPSAPRVFPAPVDPPAPPPADRA
jgi:membrane protein DedA with SNARE-associated domain